MQIIFSIIKISSTYLDFLGFISHRYLYCLQVKGIFLVFIHIHMMVWRGEED